MASPLRAVREETLKIGVKLFAGFVLLASGLGCAPTARTESAGGATGAAGGGGDRLVVGIVFDSGGIGDKSFNDSANAGLERAKAELGIEARPVNSATERDYETNLRTLAEQGCDLVIAVGINMRSALEVVAPDFPDVKFALVDAEVDRPNVRSLKFKEEEGSFLVGYLAGLMTRTGKIGFVGGMQLDLIEKFRVGYVAGARTANQYVEVLPPKYTGDWNNVDKAKASALLLFSQGADIVYHAAGRAGLGVIDAARERGRYAIGVDSDQDGVAPGRVLTSMIKRVDVAVFETIRDLKEGRFTGGTKVYDLKGDGVGISPLTYTKDEVGPERLAKLEEIRREIVSGSIVVPSTPAELDAYLRTLR